MIDRRTPAALRASARCQRTQGLALVAVLWIVAALSISALGLLRVARDEIQQVTQQRSLVQAQAVGAGAIALVLQNLQAQVGKGALASTYPVKLDGWAIVVDAAPLNGLINLNQAGVPLLAATLQHGGGAAPGDAQRLAQAIDDMRKEAGANGQAAGLDAPEDLLAIPGFDYELYARIRPLVTASLSGGGQVNPQAAPAAVLAVLAQGNTAVAQQLASARGASPQAMDTTRLNAAFLDTSSSPTLVLTAHVTLPDGALLHTSRTVALMPGGGASAVAPWTVLQRWQSLELRPSGAAIP